jgi:hypothetical protein
LDRRIDDIVRGAFAKVDVETYYIRGPRIACFMYRGAATAP